MTMDLFDMIAQCVSDSDRWFPGHQDLGFTTLAMVGEAGEVANIIKKIVRGSITIEEAMDVNFMKGLDKDPLQVEIVDVLIYLCNLMGASEFKDVNWNEIWNAKRDFNEQRFGTTELQDRIEAEYGLPNPEEFKKEPTSE